MKFKVLAAFVLTAVPLQVFAASDFVTFDGSVRHGQAPATSFQLVVPAGETSRLTLDDGTVLEFTAAASHAKSARSMVELLDASGKQLHKATWPGDAPSQRSFRYVVCGDRAIFFSPASKSTAAPCPQ
ncbi:MAG: hypothetical protein KGJ97_02305 [Xanthomonadaceae bacterium]|nr:hypothetical protein [Xanthomonadaceae bacterium]MDE3071848.1 hypothetical protein [Pseudomonadota bacterium]